MRLVSARTEQVEIEVGNGDLLLLERSDYDQPWSIRFTMFFESTESREFKNPEELEQHIRDSFTFLLTDFDKDKFINLMSLLP